MTSYATVHLAIPVAPPLSVRAAKERSSRRRTRCNTIVTKKFRNGGVATRRAFPLS
jgi:hypothetical protein